jgi:hypothetical protein
MNRLDKAVMPTDQLKEIFCTFFAFEIPSGKICSECSHNLITCNAFLNKIKDQHSSNPEAPSTSARVMEEKKEEKEEEEEMENLINLPPSAETSDFGEMEVLDEFRENVVEEESQKSTEEPRAKKRKQQPILKKDDNVSFKLVNNEPKIKKKRGPRRKIEMKEYPLCSP